MKDWLVETFLDPLNWWDGILTLVVLFIILILGMALFRLVLFLGWWSLAILALAPIGALSRWLEDEW